MPRRFAYAGPDWSEKMLYIPGLGASPGGMPSSGTCVLPRRIVSSASRAWAWRMSPGVFPMPYFGRTSIAMFFTSARYYSKGMFSLTAKGVAASENACGSCSRTVMPMA